MKKEKILFTVLFLCMALALTACTAGAAVPGPAVQESTSVQSEPAEIPEEQTAAVELGGFCWLAQYAPDFQPVEDAALEGMAVFTRALSGAEQEDLKELLVPEQWAPCEERRELDWQQPEVLLLNDAHTRIVLKEDVALVVCWDLPAWLGDVQWYALPEGTTAAAAAYCAQLPQQPASVRETDPLPKLSEYITLGVPITPWDRVPLPMTATAGNLIEDAVQQENWQRIAVFSYASGLGSGALVLNNAQGDVIGLHRSNWLYTWDGSTGQYRQFLVSAQAQADITALADALQKQVESIRQTAVLPVYAYLAEEKESAFGKYWIPAPLNDVGRELAADCMTEKNCDAVSEVPAFADSCILYAASGMRLELGVDENGVLYAVKTDPLTAETAFYKLKAGGGDSLEQIRSGSGTESGGRQMLLQESADGLWKLYAVDAGILQEEAAEKELWVLEDVKNEHFRVLCASSFRHGSAGYGFWENGDLYLVERDALHVYTAADGYRTEIGLELSFGPLLPVPILLHAVYRDPVSMEYLVLYSEPKNGVSEYTVAACTADGKPKAQWPTGVKTVWFDEATGRESGTVLTVEGSTLTVLLEYGIMPYDTAPIFRFDLAAHTVEDLSVQLTAQR